MSASRARGPGLGLVAVAALLAGSLASPILADDESRPVKPLSENPTSVIDRLLAESWEATGIKPSPVAPDAEFLRRACLDLLGRIPSVEEAASFLGSKEDDRRARLIDTLLEHPDYAKHMANLWRVALVGRRSQDRQVDRAALETWLRRQFSENRPWNEVAYELVTARGSNKDNGATNFILAHDADGAVNLTSITTRTLLGQQLQCTQCHDHPSNDWRQADFWGINAFFRGIRTREVRVPGANGLEVVDHVEVYDEPTDEWVRFEKRNAVMEIAFPKYLDGRKISQGADVDRREALGRFITEPENLQFARAYVNRVWGQLMGRGIVHPIDDFGDHNPPSHPELLDRLASDFAASGYDTKALVRWIANSRAYNLTSVTTKSNDKDETLFSHMLMKPLTPEQLFDSLLVATAAHKAGGDADTERRRQQWLNQITFAFGNDEAEETTSFQGTIPQALMMMNGDLMARATGGQPGSFLARLRDTAVARRQGRPETYMVNMLYLAALSRAPTAAEMRRAEGFLTSSPDTLGVLEDLFWALLNSNEFILNH